MTTLTKALIDEMLDEETITRKRYKEIQGLINETLDYLVRKVLCSSVTWYDYDNEGGDERSPGQFDPRRYDEYIGITGEVNLKYPNAVTGENTSHVYDLDIPLEWLFVNPDELEVQLASKEADCKKEIEAKKLADKEKRERKKKKDAERANKLPDIIKSVRSKLTEEELSYIEFTSKTIQHPKG